MDGSPFFDADFSDVADSVFFNKIRLVRSVCIEGIQSIPVALSHYKDNAFRPFIQTFSSLFHLKTDKFGH